MKPTRKKSCCKRQILRLKCQQHLQRNHFFASFSSVLFAFLSVICDGPLLHHTNRTNAHCINRHNHAIYTDFSSAASFRCKIATEIHFVDRMQRFRLKFIHHLLGCCLVEDDFFFASFQYPKLKNVLECASNKWYDERMLRCAWTVLSQHPQYMCDKRFHQQRCVNCGGGTDNRARLSRSFYCLKKSVARDFLRAAYTLVWQRWIVSSGY